MTRQWNGSVVEGGEERFRREKERELREELFRRHRGDLESSGALGRVLMGAKLSLEARRKARRLSGRGWYLGT